MIAEALEHLAEQAVLARGPDFVNRPGDPPHIVHRRQTDGSLLQEITVPPMRKFRLDSLDSLVAMALEPPIAGVIDRQAVIVSSDAAFLVFDTHDCREGAVVYLKPSVEYEYFLEALKDYRSSGCLNREPVTKLRELLRYQLAGCFADPRLVDQISSLEVNQQSGASASVGRGAESLGRSITSEAKSSAGMPAAEQVFRIRRWAQPTDISERFELKCLLDPDTREASWILQPVEESFDRLESEALEMVERRLNAQLKDAGVPVYRGRFNFAP